MGLPGEVTEDSLGEMERDSDVIVEVRVAEPMGGARDGAGDASPEVSLYLRAKRWCISEAAAR